MEFNTRTLQDDSIIVSTQYSAAPGSQDCSSPVQIFLSFTWKCQYVKTK